MKNKKEWKIHSFSLIRTSFFSKPSKKIDIATNEITTFLILGHFEGLYKLGSYKKVYLASWKTKYEVNR